MSMAFRSCPECRWNKVGHYCGKQFTLNGFECINFDKKETKEVNKTIQGDNNNMRIYWKEECKYCQNREDCKYKKQMTEFKEALSYMEKSARGIYGRLRFNCDYFVVDEEEYWKNNIGERGE